MDKENMAANATEEVAGNANPETEASTETTSEGQASTEVVTQDKPEDVTKTQAFAHRLKEETSKAAQMARDAFIAEQGYEWNGKPITTEAEYKQALQESAEAQRKADLQEKGIDPSLVEEYVESNPTVKWAKEFKSQQEAKEFADKNKVDFLTWFKETNNRDYDPAKDTLPDDVWVESEKYEKSRGKEGKSLIDSYVKHENTILKAKIAELEKGKQVEQTNQANAQASTGSVTGLGNPGTDFISKAQYDAMSMEEVAKNYDRVMQSRKHWK